MNTINLVVQALLVATHSQGEAIAAALQDRLGYDPGEVRFRCVAVSDSDPDGPAQYTFLREVIRDHVTAYSGWSHGCVKALASVAQSYLARDTGHTIDLVVVPSQAGPGGVWPDLVLGLSNPLPDSPAGVWSQKEKLTLSLLAKELDARDQAKAAGSLLQAAYHDAKAEAVLDVLSQVFGRKDPLR